MKKYHFFGYKNSVKSLFLLVIFLLFSSFFTVKSTAFAMPFYSLNPQEICLRGSFSTEYFASSDARKNNIKLASNSLDGVLVDAKKEFSFNRTVGERTEKRGYQNAKIIVGGEFVDGVGGGVCQVSSTLYNAILLADLPVTEYHPHSLSVGYVPPSFDAMVNSSYADLKFINDTDNPILIFARADGEKLTVEIYGEKPSRKLVRKSVLTELVEPLEDRIIIDENGDFPELYEDEFIRIKHPRKGIKSEGYLLAYENGKLISEVKIRTDYYKSIRGVLVKGVKVREIPTEPDLEEILSPFIYKKNL